MAELEEGSREKVVLKVVLLDPKKDTIKTVQKVNLKDEHSD